MADGFHVVNNGSKSPVEEVVGQVRHDSDGQTGDGGEQGLGNGSGKVGWVGIDTFILKEEKSLIAGEDRPEKSEQGCDSGDCGDGADSPLQNRDFDESGGLNRPADAVDRLVEVQECGLDHVGDRPGGFFADGEGFGQSPFAEEVLDPIDKIADLNLPLVKEEGALYEEDEA